MAVEGGIWVLTLLPVHCSGRRTESPDVIQAAKDRDRGILLARRPQSPGEFHLFFNEHRAMLLFFDVAQEVIDTIEAWQGPCFVAGFPNRPRWPEDRVEYCCGCGDCYFASGRHSLPRGDGFLLFQECLRAGGLPTHLPEKKASFTQPALPGMEEFLIPDEEWRRVEWYRVESGDEL